MALEYLKHGFRVHATARSQEKADDWLDLHYIARLNTKFFIVKDAAGPGAFDEAIKGVEIVAHTASPFHFDTKDNVADMLSPALDVSKADIGIVIRVLRNGLYVTGYQFYVRERGENAFCEKNGHNFFIRGNSRLQTRTESRFYVSI